MPIRNDAPCAHNSLCNQYHDRERATAGAWREGRGVARTFYRIIKSPQATPDDFRSQKELGAALRSTSPEAIVAYDGVSVFATAAQARAANALPRKPIGTHLATLMIADALLAGNDPGIRVQRTFAQREGHHTLWGDKQLMHRCVTGIEAV